MVTLAGDGCDLRFVLAIDLGLVESRGEKNIKQHRLAKCEILAEDIDADTVAVVAAKGVDLSAGRLDSGCDFFCAALLGSFDHGIAHQASQPVIG